MSLSVILHLCTGHGTGEGSQRYQCIHEAAEKSARAGAGEEKTSDQPGEDGGAQQAKS